MLKKAPHFFSTLLIVLLCFLLLCPAALAYQTNLSCGSVSYGCHKAPQQNNSCQGGSIWQSQTYCPTVKSCQPTASCPKSNTAASPNCVQVTIVQPTQGSNGQQATVTAPAQAASPQQSNLSTQTQQNTQTSVQSSYAAEVVRLVNVERAKYNLAPLTMDKALSAAAQIRAQEANSKFSHTRPNDKSCFTVLAEQGISYRAAGENIAKGQQSPAQVVQAWMDSPGHRANILGDYTKIGVGVTQASGGFNGYAWAQFFTR